MNERMRPLVQTDLRQVLEWRNHPNVRKFMYTSREISWHEHLNWFNANVHSKRHFLLIYEQSEIPLGFVKFSVKTCPQICDWGFYLAPNAAKGTGQALGRTALNYAFDELMLHKVCGEALYLNEKSRRFHARLGFIEEGYHHEHHFDGEKYHDVVSFGLLRKNWQMSEVNNEARI